MKNFAFANNHEATNMDEPFGLFVSYKGEEQLFAGLLKPLGYIHRFLVIVYGRKYALNRIKK